MEKVIKGGNGGNLSTTYSACDMTIYSGCGGSGGNGNSFISASIPTQLSITGNAFVAGSSGVAGIHGSPTSYYTGTCG